MQNITSTAGLKNAIQQLEVEQTVNEQLLKEKFHHIRESLKPVNLLKSSLKNTVSRPDLTEDIIGPAIVLATSYLSKKIVVGTSESKGRKLLGSIIQYGVMSYVAQHPDAIKSLGQFIVQHVFSAKKKVHHDDHGE